MPRLLCLLLLATGLLPTPGLSAEPLPVEAIRKRIEESIQKGDCPGAFLAVVRDDDTAIFYPFGSMATRPEAREMRQTTIFDLASLTKPVATATAIFRLYDQGKLKLNDPVAKHWPEFAAEGKGGVTVEHCLLHTSGLTADNPLADYADGREAALKRVAALKLEAQPGARFRYSDVGFIVLGHLVERISGENLEQFCQEQIFGPMKMHVTGFKPRAQLLPLIAPTGQRDGKWLVGEVHDPRAAKLGGIAGHAGLFSDGNDLSRFVRMLLREGELDRMRILSPGAVRLMTEPVPVPGGLRSRGWDVDTSFSAPRGKGYPRGTGFGHTGFTGTSIWVDPASGTAIILLANRVHPDEKGNMTALRSDLATLIAGKQPKPAPPAGEVLTGVDVLAREQFARLKGKKVALVTNHTGRDRAGRSTIDLLHAAPGVKLVALFSPEHGIRGLVDEKVGDGTDEKTGLPIYSLYGKRTRPTAETLEGVDTIVYDIQDIGCRFYTYISTLGNVLEAAHELKREVVVLDRPNPIGGLAVEGPLTDAGKESFIAYHSLPIRHGMTVGELAKMFQSEKKLEVQLTVIPVQNWTRGMLLDRTGLAWVNPSPNMRNLTEALLYPGVGLLETTNVSVGRGTERPFEWVGAPWIDGGKLALVLTRRNIPGVRFVPCDLTPTGSTHANKRCGGVQIFVDDWSRLEPVALGMHLALTLGVLYPDDWNVAAYNRLLVHRTTHEALKQLEPLERIQKDWEKDLQSFRERRAKFLLYAE